MTLPTVIAPQADGSMARLTRLPKSEWDIWVAGDLETVIVGAHVDENNRFRDHIFAPSELWNEWVDADDLNRLGFDLVDGRIARRPGLHLLPKWHWTFQWIDGDRLSVFAHVTQEGYGRCSIFSRDELPNDLVTAEDLANLKVAFGADKKRPTLMLPDRAPKPRSTSDK